MSERQHALDQATQLLRILADIIEDLPTSDARRLRNKARKAVNVASELRHATKLIEDAP